MAFQKQIIMNGVLEDAYMRVTIHDFNNNEKSFRIDVYRLLAETKDLTTRVMIYRGARSVPHYKEVNGEQVDLWALYKLDTAGMQEAGRDPIKGIYEYLAAEDDFFADAIAA